ncbi:replication-relaxation family protein [Lentzea sp. NPDC005914]|uniref:replication-relaxation family protein n=1 Tax=Lentzea sp. NPDC005914 TaxID=3154572 RepID=UPI0033C03C07
MTDGLIRGRAARLRERLSERDMQVLASLYQLRLLTSRQVQRLHLSEGSAHTQSRRTRSLLQRLTELGVVVRLDRTVGGVQPGSTALVYGLSGLGLAVLEVQGPYGGRRRRVWETKPFFMHHVLGVSELCVGLSELTQDSRLQLLAFDGEPLAWRKFTSDSGAPTTLKPDAYVRVGMGEFEHSAFIELDMASESLPTVQRKCLTYIGYWRSGAEQQAFGVFPLVVWLVPDTNHKRRMREVIARLDADAQRLFAVALQADGPVVLTAPTEDES